jgi:hypothetical protein
MKRKELIRMQRGLKGGESVHKDGRSVYYCFVFSENNSLPDTCAKTEAAPRFASISGCGRSATTAAAPPFESISGCGHSARTAAAPQFASISGGGRPLLSRPPQRLPRRVGGQQSRRLRMVGLQWWTRRRPRAAVDKAMAEWATPPFIADKNGHLAAVDVLVKAGAAVLMARRVSAC